MSYSAFSRAGLAMRTVIGCGTVILTTTACHHSRIAVPVNPREAELVEVGYGAQPRRDVTGAVESATATWCRPGLHGSTCSRMRARRRRTVRVAPTG